MAELQELIKDAPKFASMERGELVAYAYGMYAAGAKTDAENAKLRELCKRVLKNCYDAYEQVWGWDDDWVILCDEARELGVEVDG